LAFDDINHPQIAPVSLVLPEAAGTPLQQDEVAYSTTHYLVYWVELD